MADEIVKAPEEMGKPELAAAIAAEQAKLSPEKPVEVKPEPAKPAEPKAETKSFEFKASDGTVYSAETQEELFSKVTGALNHTKTHAKNLEFKIHDLKNQVPKPEEKKPEPEEKFDQKKYVELMETDALAAEMYVEKFKPKPEWAKHAEQQQQVTQANLTLQREIYKFYESPAGQSYAKVESPELNQALLEYMRDQGLERTATNFRVAFYELRDAGKIPEIPSGKPSERPKAPPRSPSNAEPNRSTETEPDFDSMTKEQLAAYMKKNGVEVHYVK